MTQISLLPFGLFGFLGGGWQSADSQLTLEVRNSTIPYEGRQLRFVDGSAAGAPDERFEIHDAPFAVGKLEGKQTTYAAAILSIQYRRDPESAVLLFDVTTGHPVFVSYYTFVENRRETQSILFRNGRLEVKSLLDKQGNMFSKRLDFAHVEIFRLLRGKLVPQTAREAWYAKRSDEELAKTKADIKKLDREQKRAEAEKRRKAAMDAMPKPPHSSILRELCGDYAEATNTSIKRLSIQFSNDPNWVVVQVAGKNRAFQGTPLTKLDIANIFGTELGEAPATGLYTNSQYGIRVFHVTRSFRAGRNGFQAGYYFNEGPSFVRLAKMTGAKAADSDQPDSNLKLYCYTSKSLIEQRSKMDRRGMERFDQTLLNGHRAYLVLARYLTQKGGDDFDKLIKEKAVQVVVVRGPLRGRTFWVYSADLRASYEPAGD